MTISSAVKRSCLIHSSSPQIVIVDDNKSKTIITYRQGLSLIHRHRQWIEDTVREVALHKRRHPFSSSIQRDEPLTNDSEENDGDVEIVVSYLSQNSPNVIYSVLGCIDASLSSSSSSSSTISIIPALLNARWTCNELSAALAPPSPPPVSSHDDDDGGSPSSNDNNHHRRRQRHVTIMLYDPLFEETARDTIHHLRQTDNHDESYAIPLPHFHPPSNDNHDTTTNNDDDPNHHHPPITSPALVIFTSGTSSGTPHGALLSHLSLLTQSLAKMNPPCRYSSRTSLVATLPYYHVGGTSSILAVMLAGGRLVFPCFGKGLSSSFGAGEVLWEAVRGGGGDTLVVVPAMIRPLVEVAMRRRGDDDDDERDDDDDDDKMAAAARRRRVKLVLVGGQSLSRDEWQLATKAFPKARFVQTYACTEAGSSMTFGVLDDLFRSDGEDGGEVERGNDVGVPPPHVAIGIFSSGEDGDGHDTLGERRMLPPYEVGIIGTKGPHVMNGYWNRGRRRRRRDHSSSTTLSSRNKNNIKSPPHGWILTGDLGYLDRNHHLHYCGRATDVIRTGGETVFAPDVERALTTLEWVSSCAVFPLKDERFGEIVSVAIVVMETGGDDDGTTTTTAEGMGETREEEWLEVVKRHCRACGLAGYKTPRRVFVVKELPRNSSGKVLKRELVRMFGGERRGGREQRRVMIRSRL